MRCRAAACGCNHPGASAPGWWGLVPPHTVLTQCRPSASSHSWPGMSDRPKRHPALSKAEQDLAILHLQQAQREQLGIAGRKAAAAKKRGEKRKAAAAIAAAGKPRPSHRKKLIGEVPPERLHHSDPDRLRVDSVTEEIDAKIDTERAATDVRRQLAGSDRSDADDERAASESESEDKAGSDADEFAINKQEIDFPPGRQARLRKKLALNRPTFHIDKATKLSPPNLSSFPPPTVVGAAAANATLAAAAGSWLVVAPGAPAVHVPGERRPLFKRAETRDARAARLHNAAVDALQPPAPRRVGSRIGAAAATAATPAAAASSTPAAAAAAASSPASALSAAAAGVAIPSAALSPRFYSPFASPEF